MRLEQKEIVPRLASGVTIHWKDNLERNISAQNKMSHPITIPVRNHRCSSGELSVPFHCSLESLHGNLDTTTWAAVLASHWPSPKDRTSRHNSPRAKSNSFSCHSKPKLSSFTPGFGFHSPRPGHSGLPGHLYENPEPITTTIFQLVFDSIQSPNIIFPKYQPGFLQYHVLQLVFRLCTCRLLVWIQLQDDPGLPYIVLRLQRVAAYVYQLLWLREKIDSTHGSGGFESLIQFRQFRVEMQRFLKCLKDHDMISIPETTWPVFAAGFFGKDGTLVGKGAFLRLLGDPMVHQYAVEKMISYLAMLAPLVFLCDDGYETPVPMSLSDGLLQPGDPLHYNPDSNVFMGVFGSKLGFLDANTVIPNETDPDPPDELQLRRLLQRLQLYKDEKKFGVLPLIGFRRIPSGVDGHAIHPVHARTEVPFATLHECMRSRPPPDEHMRVLLAFGIAQAVMHLHLIGWTHGQLTPSNILVPTRDISQPRIRGFRLGPPWYRRAAARPKCLWDASGQAALDEGRASDVWNLGWLLLEIFIWHGLGGAEEQPAVPTPVGYPSSAFHEKFAEAFYGCTSGLAATENLFTPTAEPTKARTGLYWRVVRPLEECLSLLEVFPIRPPPPSPQAPRSFQRHRAIQNLDAAVSAVRQGVTVEIEKSLLSERTSPEPISDIKGNIAPPPHTSGTQNSSREEASNQTSEAPAQNLTRNKPATIGSTKGCIVIKGMSESPPPGCTVPPPPHPRDGHEQDRQSPPNQTREAMAAPNQEEKCYTLAATTTATPIVNLDAGDARENLSPPATPLPPPPPPNSCPPSELDQTKKDAEDAPPKRAPSDTLRMFPIHTSPEILKRWHAVTLPSLECCLQRLVGVSKVPIGPLTIDLLSIGTSVETSQPTIVVTCRPAAVGPVRTYLKKKFAYDTTTFELKVRKGGTVRRSLYGRYRRRRLASRSRASPSSASILINRGYQQRPSSGASIGACRDGEDLPPGTFGGVISVDGNLYGLTCHHLLDPLTDDEFEMDDSYDSGSERRFSSTGSQAEVGFLDNNSHLVLSTHGSARRVKMGCRGKRTRTRTRVRTRMASLIMLMIWMNAMRANRLLSLGMAKLRRKTTTSLVLSAVHCRRQLTFPAVGLLPVSVRRVIFPASQSATTWTSSSPSRRSTTSRPARAYP